MVGCWLLGWTGFTLTTCLHKKNQIRSLYWLLHLSLGFIFLSSWADAVFTTLLALEIAFKWSDGIGKAIKCMQKTTRLSYSFIRIFVFLNKNENAFDVNISAFFCLPWSWRIRKRERCVIKMMPFHFRLLSKLPFQCKHKCEGIENSCDSSEKRRILRPLVKNLMLE